MASRCTFGEHGKCSACEKFVSPNLTDHVHIYRGRGHANNVICDECWLSAAIGAEKILSACDAAGIRFEGIDALHYFLQHNVTIGIQLPFAIPPASAN